MAAGGGWRRRCGLLESLTVVYVVLAAAAAAAVSPPAMLMFCSLLPRSLEIRWPLFSCPSHSRTTTNKNKLTGPITTPQAATIPNPQPITRTHASVPLYTLHTYKKKHRTYMQQQKKKQPRTGGAYFIGKSLWAKGYDRLLDLLEYNNERLGRPFHMDVYGSGPDREEIQARARAKGCDLTFFPATDHSELGNYSVFINPSVREGANGGDLSLLSLLVLPSWLSLSWAGLSLA